MADSLVSIVIPAYNVANYIARCVESLEQQTYSNYEVIFVNDGSTDNTQKLLEEIVAKDKRYRLINQKNKGLSGARNTGIDEATGKYIYFLDPDDWIAPELIEVCVGYLEEKQVDMVFFDFYLAQSATEYKKQEWFSDRPDGLYTPDEALAALFDCQFGNYAWSSLAKLDLFKNNKIYFPEGRTYEDLGTTYRLLGNSQKIGYLDKHLYYYYQNNMNSITKTWKYQDYLDTKLNLEEIATYIAENYPAVSHRLINLELNMLFLFLDQSYGSKYTASLINEIDQRFYETNGKINKKNKVKYLLLKTRLYFLIKKLRGQVKSGSVN